MPGCDSCRLYLHLDALENFDMSDFPTHLEVNTADRKRVM